MKRKEASQILKSVGIGNKFSLRTVDFSDLTRCTRQFCTIKNWEFDKAKYQAVKQAFRYTNVIVDFEPPKGTPYVSSGGSFAR